MKRNLFRKSKINIHFIIPASIVVIGILLLLFNNTAPTSAIEGGEYLTKINLTIKNLNTIVDNAQDLGKELQAKKIPSAKFTEKYFNEVLNKADGIIEEVMTMQVPPQFNEAHLYIILYVKWLNIGLYEVISGNGNEQSEFCINRSEFFKKKFEKTIKNIKIK